MEKDVLSEVIVAEKEIQKYFEQEQVVCRQRLAKLKREAEDEIIRAENMIKESFKNAVEKAETDAEHRAAEIIKNAALNAERLKNMKSETMAGLVMKQIHRILPG